MRLQIQVGDLLTQKEDLVLCIGADLCMSTGLAARIQQRSGYQCGSSLKAQRLKIGQVGLFSFDDGRRAFFLVTKQDEGDKPTHDSLYTCLVSLAAYCETAKIENLIMPALGCGVDGLHWFLVDLLIRKAFFDQLHMTITVFSAEPRPSLDDTTYQSSS